MKFLYSHICSAMFLVMFLTVACTSTSSGKKFRTICSEKISFKETEFFRPGFCGADSYRVLSQGIPEWSLTDRNKRRSSSLKAAVIAARYRLIGKFEGACIETCVYNCPDFTKKKLWLKKIAHEIKASPGKILFKNWDSNDQCTIIFEFTRPKLKGEFDKCGEE